MCPADEDKERQNDSLTKEFREQGFGSTPAPLLIQPLLATELLKCVIGASGALVTLVVRGAAGV
jgi:hypothetical protein